MIISYSKHWIKQKKFRPKITDGILELCISNSNKIKDNKSEDAYNAISKIPASGRILKVVYKERYVEKSKHIK